MDKFGQLMILIESCLKDIVQFFVLWSISMVTTTFLYSILGVQILNEELYYPYINKYWAFVALCVRSSVGDIQSPSF